jgi:hypothetical protein
MVSKGTAGPAALTGLPAGSKELRKRATGSRRGTLEGARVAVTEGKAGFTPGATSFAPLMTAEGGAQ